MALGLVWSECVPPNAYVEALTSKVMVLGCGVSGRWLGGGWSPPDRMSVLRKGLPRHFCHMRTQREAYGLEEGLTPPRWNLASECQPPEL